MIFELHVIQNVAPSNLNRDDTGAPKDAIFGGYRRARVSSQAWKRAIRNTFAECDLVSAERRAIRTKRLIRSVQDGLMAVGHSIEESLLVAETLLAGLEIGRDPQTDDSKPDTEYLILLHDSEIIRLVEIADRHWGDLLKLSRGKTKVTKKNGKKLVPEPVRTTAAAVLDGGGAADTALFGRMLADLPRANIDGAAQVAHAISTHAVEMEFDFFTAIDDLKLQERKEHPELGTDAGAEMMGTVEFTSSTLYRYTNVDLGQLERNLGGDVELAMETLRAYAEAFLTSMPTGKQNSFAAQNPPSFALAVIRTSGRWSLANAFVEPVQKGRGDLVGRSIEALDSYWQRITTMYGDDDIVALPVFIDGQYSVTVGSTSTDLNDWLDDIQTALTTAEG